MHITARKFGLFAWLLGIAVALALAGCDGLLSAEDVAGTEAAEGRSAVALAGTAEEGTTLILIGTTEGASYRADVYVQGTLPSFLPEPSEAESADAAPAPPEDAGSGEALADGDTVRISLKAKDGGFIAAGPYTVKITEKTADGMETAEYKADVTFGSETVVLNWGGGKPEEPPADGTASFAAAIAGITGDSGSRAKVYSLAAGEETFASSPTLEMPSYNPVSVTIDGGGRTLAGRGASRLTVGAGVTLTLRNITLERVPVTVDNGGKLILEDGAAITGNSETAVTVRGSRTGNGGAVTGNGFFEMNGGEISGNTGGTAVADLFYYENGFRPGMAGGGVFVEGGGLSDGGIARDGGRFIMRGGKITDNSITGADAIVAGGGVYVGENAVFTMRGGEISRNSVFASPGSGYAGTADPPVSARASGGGVFVEGGGFAMTGGRITDNTAGSGDYHSYGGGVYVMGAYIAPSGASDGNWYTKKGVFTMGGNAEISANKAEGEGNARGGGIFVDYLGDFTMEDGEVRGNMAASRGTVSSMGNDWSWYEASGGGIAMDYGSKFTMTGGGITDNSAEAWVTNGAGVALHGRDGYHSVFDMKGGIISGNRTGHGNYHVAGMLPDGRGGGLYAGDGSRFTMSGGKITGNAAARGGGVYYYAGPEMKTTINGVTAPENIMSVISNLTGYIHSNTATSDTASNNVFKWIM